MSDAPERVYIYDPGNAVEYGVKITDQKGAGIQSVRYGYVRVDIFEAAKAAARAEGERIGMERAAGIVTSNCWFKAAKLIRAAMDAKPTQPEYPSDADIDRSLSTARLLPDFLKPVDRP